MNNIVNKAPNLIEAIEYVERLKNAKWPKLNQFEEPNEFLKKVEEILYRDFEVIPDIKKRYKPSEFTLPFFRVREISSFTDINFFSEHSYPPINKTGFNRCNYPNSPTFYCSDNPLTALLEVIKDRDYKTMEFCLSKWALIETNQELTFQTFFHSESNPDNRFTSIREKELEQFNIIFGEKLNKDKIAGLTALLKFIHNSFINDKDYALSASLAHRTLNAKHILPTDILMYPSQMTKYKGVNMAIHPNFVDNRMVAERFYIIKLENYNLETEKFDLYISNYGALNNNRILWHNIDENDSNFLNHFHNDFKHIIKSGFKAKFSKTK